MLPAEHGKTPEWRKLTGEKALGVKVTLHQLSLLGLAHLNYGARRCGVWR